MTNRIPLLQQMLQKKPIDTCIRQSKSSGLKRTLGIFQLTCLGIGVIIGTGIFVLTGRAAAENAGPSIAISFVIGAIVSGFSALSYSEMTTIIPISGSAYSYTISSLGEIFGWIVGWDLLLEYVVGCSTVASGWSAYILSFFQDVFGVTFPVTVTRSPFSYKNDKFVVNKGSYINVPAIFITAAIAGILCFGIRESSAVNIVVVIIKVSVIILFIFGSLKYVDRENLKPFIPKAENGQFGVVGIIKGAQKVFFSYLGFDAISVVAQEAKNPQRDLPIAVVSSLGLCTALYIGTSLVLCGIAPYKELNEAAPIAFALRRHPNTKYLQILVSLGAVAGLTSVILVSLLSQSRLFMVIANDGLFPKIFSRLHPKFKTPVYPTIICATCVSVLAGLLPVELLGDMTSVGTLFAFLSVNICVIVLRFTDPHRHRDFKVPLGPFVFPVLGSIISIALIVVSGASTIIRLFVWLAIGLVIYFVFARRHSKIRGFIEENETYEEEEIPEKFTQA
ncbi:putative amino acid permease YfnA [Smittium culicis]|uniref:Putative amino acid permease YfnA n=1 Tax=Smittium culicis TaxID=133412 RepID=A0A1R1XC40_9FUNG|nr:putative amino acid permease YfnA [Smittium culicis]OMJ12446.1 putative amino acid permease YfnA [Smittium culicis]